MNHQLLERITQGYRVLTPTQNLAQRILDAYALQATGAGYTLLADSSCQFMVWLVPLPLGRTDFPENRICLVSSINMNLNYSGNK